MVYKLSLGWRLVSTGRKIAPTAYALLPHIAVNLHTLSTDSS